MADQVQVLPDIIRAVDRIIRDKAEEVTALDQAIGDGDHVFNLQRGIDALLAQADGFAELAWADAFKKIGTIVMSTVGGASGSLYATLFLGLAKSLKGRDVNLRGFAAAFAAAVEAVKARGKADLGEKTMLDVLIPVAGVLQQAAVEAAPIEDVLANIARAAEAGVEATRDLLATKGRASFVGERARGHLDPGARTAQLMIGAVCGVLSAG